MIDSPTCVIGKCLVCYKEITNLPCFPDNPDNAGEVTIKFYYGSKHDLITANGHICDSCYTAKVKPLVSQGLVHQGYRDLL